MSGNLTTELHEGVLILTLCRPEKKNALTRAMYDGLSAGLERAREDNLVRAVLFQSEGDSFTAGNDLADFQSQSSGNSDGEGAPARFLRNLATTDKPVVAAVQGNAVGVGTTMLLHCDMVYLSEDARLITPFVNLALVPEAASSLLLPARIGHARAFAMFALAEPMTAADALASGLANAVVQRDELRSRALGAARTLAGKAAGSLRATKRLMRGDRSILVRMEEEGAIFKERLQTAEAREAFAAFAERRQPDFSRF
ncbi:enoyl-CoA hydratase-related protein [Tardiphaga sp. 42S5]|uniref:enoyl-CoA hydratase-related protein n=1 Tax=Tardiphaga sp. 42S5 TaxID=1404799 RepID=UPI002A5A1079|nr:enoyl-CoA hydratase-related protein [Tardiphaga sp. 42S5]WPO43973.1 enoyl-CoA hydratase-related protein [Tardiphaga sp. 42S5]